MAVLVKKSIPRLCDITAAEASLQNLVAHFSDHPINLSNVQGDPSRCSQGCVFFFITKDPLYKEPILNRNLGLMSTQP